MLNILSSYGWYGKSLWRSHNYQPVKDNFIQLYLVDRNNFSQVLVEGADRFHVLLIQSKLKDFHIFQELLFDDTLEKKKDKTYILGWCILWQYGLSSFQAGGIKLRIFLPTNQHTQRKCFNIENWSLSSLQKPELIILISHVKNLN